YVCFEDLWGNLDKLAAHGVQVEFHPVFLGGINHLSGKNLLLSFRPLHSVLGNKPPWTLAAKADYLARDAPRAASRVGITALSPPRDLLSRARTQSALRALLFIKANFARETFLSALRFLFRAFWTPPNGDVVDEESLRALLAGATAAAAAAAAAAAGGGESGDDARGGGDGLLFSRAEVDAIMEGRGRMKEALVEETGRAVEAGAFGCPWLVVEDARGRVEPFFGSDRFNHIYRHLGVPFQDVSLLDPAPGSKL
ncbi:hypothetical protein E4U41_001443, partial [Claviceps citrina]